MLRMVLQKSTDQPRTILRVQKSLKISEHARNVALRYRTLALANQHNLVRVSPLRDPRRRDLLGPNLKDNGCGRRLGCIDN